MFKSIEDFGRMGQEQVENAAATAGVITKSCQTLAEEAAAYSKRSMETSSKYLEKLFAVRSFDGAVEVQSDFARDSYEGFVLQAARVGGVLSTLTTEAFKPMEDAFAKAQVATK